MKKLIGLFCAMLTLCGWLAMPMAAEVKVAMEEPESTPYIKLFNDVFVKYVTEKTDGRLKFNIYYNRSMGNADTVFQGLQFGTIQMTINTTSNLANFAKNLQLIDLPYLMPNMEAAKKVFASPEGQKMLGELEKKGVDVLAVWPSCLRVIITSSPIKNLEDVQGMKLRTTPSKTHMANVASLGMAPTPMPGSEILTGLQQGVVKGMDADITSLYVGGFYEPAPYMFDSQHIGSNWLLICSDRWLKSLSPEDRKVVEEAGKLYEDALYKFYAEYNKQLIREMVEKKGVHYLAPDEAEKARWIKKSESAYEALPEDQKKIAKRLRDVAWGK